MYCYICSSYYCMHSLGQSMQQYNNMHSLNEYYAKLLGQNARNYQEFQEKNKPPMVKDSPLKPIQPKNANKKLLLLNKEFIHEFTTL